MLINKIQIEKFRGFKNTTIPLGSTLTLIAGQNGTGKSTILGMLGQPFSCTVPAELKDFFGLSVKTEFSDIFKFSPEKDIPGEHIYFLFPTNPNLHPDGESIQVKSYKRTDKRAEKDDSGKEIKDPNRPSTFIRLVTGKKREKKNAGGNIENIPVVYLGLRRLQPLGEAKGLVPGEKPSPNDENFLIRKHKQILKLNHIPTQDESIQSLNATDQDSHLGYRNQEYDEYANSAGQDNINKILAAIIFLDKIKNHLNTNYKGGLLLIDEIDATLFPASQETLIDELVKLAKRNNIQIIATTHSLNLLKHINTRYSCSKEVITVFLRNKKTTNGYVVESKENPTWQFIENNLEVARNDIQRVKVHVFREDDVTEFFIKQLLGPKITPNLAFEQLDFGHCELTKLSKYQWPLFQQAIFIVDGEVPDDALVKLQHGVRLPGGERPETLLYQFIKNLPDNAECWDEDSGKTSQQCFQHFAHAGEAKKWFQQLSRVDKVTFIKLWKNSCPEKIQDFKMKFINVYNQQALLVGAKQL